jgi:hypothetical protein
MRRILIGIFILFATKIVAQDTTKLLVAFPITSYMVDLNDSTKLVQIVAGSTWNIKDKQLGLVKGIYRDGNADTATKGYGKCQLIKGDYYYFAIGSGRKESSLKAGDLLYTFIDMPGKYIGQLTKIASKYINLQKVTEEFFYNRDDIFLNWDKQKEGAILDSMVADIHFTRNYFKENNPSMNQKIASGFYINSMVLDVMMTIRPKDLSDFLEYIIARPNLYAGNNWKISEIFATWLISGAPTIIKN